MPKSSPAKLTARAANRHDGVRAANPFDRFTTEMSREHNDANVLCLGARTLGSDTCLDLARFWLTVAFGEGRHGRRVAKIDAGNLAEA